MRKNKLLILFLGLMILEGCSAKFRTIAIATSLGGGIGAGLGYTVVHSGNHQQYRTQNTVISASILAAVFGLATWYHLSSLDDEKVELAGKFSRATYLDRDTKSSTRLEDIKLFKVDKKSIRLDSETRWVLPEFEKRLLPPEKTDSEMIAPHHSWDIVRPGFFVNKGEDASFFQDEDKNERK